MMFCGNQIILRFTYEVGVVTESFRQIFRHLLSDLSCLEDKAARSARCFPVSPLLLYLEARDPQMSLILGVYRKHSRSTGKFNE